MQILHPFAGSVQQYGQQLVDPDLARPAQCPQCQAKQQLTAHGFYSRTFVDCNFDGSIRVRRYLCETCKRTVSLLPEFALPYLRFGISVIAMFLVARILQRQTLQQAVNNGPYQRGQHWLRRFRAHAQSLCASLSAVTAPVAAANFEQRAVAMLNAVPRGWTGATASG
jgi:transposase-like protein